MSQWFRSALFGIAILFSNLSLAQGDNYPFVNEFLGRCFPSLGDAFQVITGDAVGQDENIIVAKADVPIKGQWIVDKTSDHNFQWYLVEERGDSGQCISLYIPFASEVFGRLNKLGLTVVAKTQASPGFPVVRMEFRRSKKLDRYVPASCFEEKRVGSRGAVTRKEIDCLNVSN